jgi:hypothetical protein
MEAADILLRRPLVQQRLDVRFGKNTAARGNRIDDLVSFASSFKPAASVCSKEAIWSM